MKTKQTKVKSAKGINNPASKAELAQRAAAILDDKLECDDRMAAIEASMANVTYGRPTITVDSLNKLFRKKYKGESGENEDDSNNVGTILDVFLRTMEHLVMSAPSFTFSDLSHLLRAYQYPPVELKELFLEWIQFAKEWKKIQECNLVYDEGSYTWV